MTPVPIERLTLSQWQANRVRTRVVTTPSLSQVEVALRRLDNRVFNDLYLHPRAADDRTYLCVGGGAGRYVVAGAEGDDRFPILVDPARSADPTERLIVGGQAGLYPQNRVHDLETALTVVRGFWATGALPDVGLAWVTIESP